MKKTNLIYYSILIALSLTACDFSNENEKETEILEILESQDLASHLEVPVIIKERIKSDFILDVGTRFNSITKDELVKAKSFSDFIAAEHANRIVHYSTLDVIVLDGDQKTNVRENGKGGDLTDAQIKLLQSIDYGTNVLIWSDYRERSFEDGRIQNSTWTPYLSVVPEQQTTYLNGKEALIDYLDKNSIDVRVDVKKDLLRPATISFRVTKNGTIENAQVVGTSGYPVIDKKLIELISKTSGTWLPAENSKGEKVDQTLVISFGAQGC